MLPKWLRQAVKDRVVSQAEAEEMYQLVESSDQEEVILPPHLFQAAERMALWEMHALPTLH